MTEIQKRYGIPETGIHFMNPKNWEPVFEHLLAWKEGNLDSDIPDFEWREAWVNYAGTQFAIWLALKTRREMVRFVKIAVESFKCAYCGEPRNDKQEYLCLSCRSRNDRDGLGSPSESYPWRRDGFLEEMETRGGD